MTINHFRVQSVTRNNGIYQVHLEPEHPESADIILLNTEEDCFQLGDVYRVTFERVDRKKATKP